MSKDAPSREFARLWSASCTTCIVATLCFATIASFRVFPPWNGSNTSLLVLQSTPTVGSLPYIERVKHNSNAALLHTFRVFKIMDNNFVVIKALEPHDDVRTPNIQSITLAPRQKL
jgi:hypothetical protein